MAPTTRSKTQTHRGTGPGTGAGHLARELRKRKETATPPKVLSGVKTKRTAKPKSKPAGKKTQSWLSTRGGRAWRRALMKFPNFAQYEAKKAEARNRLNARKAERDAVGAAEQEPLIHECGPQQQVASPQSSLPDYEYYEEQDRLLAEEQAEKQAAQ